MWQSEEKLKGDGGGGRRGVAQWCWPEAETTNQSPFRWNTGRSFAQRSESKYRIGQTRQRHGVSSTRESSRGLPNPWKAGNKHFPFIPGLLLLGPLSHKSFRGVSVQVSKGSS